MPQFLLLFLSLSKVIVMNISFFNHFMWFIVGGCQGQSGATWRGSLPFILLCFLLMYLFWAPSLSWGLVSSYLFTSSCCGNYEPCRMPERFATTILFIKMSPQKKKEKRMRATKEKRNSLSISRSSHKYCNCAVIEKKRLWVAVLWLTLSECCLTFMNELNMNTSDKKREK